MTSYMCVLLFVIGGFLSYFGHIASEVAKPTDIQTNDFNKRVTPLTVGELIAKGVACVGMVLMLSLPFLFVILQ